MGQRGRARVRVAVGLIVAAGACSMLGAAGSQDPDRLLAGFQAWLDGTRQLEARFEQTLLSGALSAGLSESGKMYLRRPGRMRWDYLDPEIKVALLDQDRMELYMEEDRQLIRSQIGEGEGDLLPTLLAGRGRLGELFEVELAEDSTGRRPRIRLTPRGRTEALEAVVVTLRGDHSIERATVLDAAGNRMDYRFSGLRRNRELPPGLFEFEPPAGTEIIGQP